MAEAIAALSLACNIFQAVSFAGEVVGLCRNVLKDGTPEPGLAKKAVLLNTFAASLESDNTRFDNLNKNEGKHPVENQAARARLRDVSADLLRLTKELQELMDKVSSKSGPSKISRVNAVFKYKIRDHSKIKALETDIDRMKGALDSELLAQICSSTEAGQALNTKEFSLLRGDVQNFIGRWAEGNRDLEDLVSTEAQTTRNHVTAETQRVVEQLGVQEAQRTLNQKENALLATLRFPEMNERYNGIEEASKDTVDWIFQKKITSSTTAGTDTAVPFTPWLRSDAPIFWISGRPGSGKSTLMRFLAHDKRKMSHLSWWKPDVDVLHFYFFEIGRSPLQSQLRGCLRTLLHQLFTCQPDIMRRYLEINPETGKKSSEHDWSVNELRQALLDSLALAENAFCIFLDGLDEQDPAENHSVLELIASLEAFTNIKLCLSSRAKIIFKKTFQDRPNIQMHQLTHNSMRAYARKALAGHENYLRDLNKDITGLEGFVCRIASSSNGIYLWTSLVLKSVLRGIQNGDSWETLETRVARYEPGLFSLYKNMWQHCNEDVPVYREQTAHLFSHFLAVAKIRRYRHSFEEILY
ncbi:hypothetical protein F5Y16DRAFT_265632 [Xylariaceae sp. FL0255]|nr:hypothetical protein F5Y16DRAFT_265632 [Xylariaceae sp. FL0255]